MELETVEQNRFVGRPVPMAAFQQRVRAAGAMFDTPARLAAMHDDDWPRNSD